MGIENEKTEKLQVTNHASKRSCHICGQRCDGWRWCPGCLSRYAGAGRRDVRTMTSAEISAEVELLLTPPYEIPLLAIYKRICELLGRDIGLNAFFMLERKREFEQAQPMTMPDYPTMPPAGQMPRAAIQTAPTAPPPLPSAVPTLKSFARTSAPTGSGVPAYMPPPQQAFPIVPNGKVAAGKPPAPPPDPASPEAPVVSLIRKPAPKPPAK